MDYNCFTKLIGIQRCNEIVNLKSCRYIVFSDVSAQAVSNWERGGYPDIVLLPQIANFFRIIIDELIGNDEAAKQADIESFKKIGFQLPIKVITRIKFVMIFTMAAFHLAVMACSIRTN